MLGLGAVAEKQRNRTAGAGWVRSKSLPEATAPAAFAPLLYNWFFPFQPAEILKDSLRGTVVLSNPVL